MCNIWMPKTINSTKRLPELESYICVLVASCTRSGIEAIISITYVKQNKMSTFSFNVRLNVNN